MRKILSLIIVTFIVFSLVFSGCTLKEGKPVVTTPLLRIGILSDIHSNTIPAYDPLERVEKALRFYKQKGVDGIIISGDLLDTFDHYDLLSLQDVWLEVFPGNTNDLTGEKVEPLFIYGNHDEGFVREEIWFDEIGSEFEEAWIKEIKGYQFVGVHYSKENGETAQKLITQAQNASADKPWFYIQHVPMPDTVVGGYTTYGGYTGFGIPTREMLKKSYNCVVFTGHTHVPVTDERSIWQGSNKKDVQFTAINCGTLYYGFLNDFCDIEITGDAYQTQQGMYMVVDGSRITIDRYSFTDMELTYTDGVGQINAEQAKRIGVSWTFDAMNRKDRPYGYETRLESAHQPTFADGATLDATEITAESVTLTIPPAAVTAPEGFSDLVQSYYVEIIDASTGEVVITKEIAAPYHIDTDPTRINQPVTVKISGLTPGTEYTICAYARECYQKSSEPISVQITTLLVREMS